MIDKLTPNQEAQLAVYRDQWIGIGLSTDPVDEEKIKPIINRLYEEILEREVPELVITMPSPVAAWYAVEQLSLYYKSDDKSEEKLQTLIKKIRANVDSGAISFTMQFVWPYLDGQFFSYYCAWATYMRDVLKVVDVDKLTIVEEIAKNMGPVWTLDDFCVVCDKPAEIHLSDTNLHCDGGPAVRYRDGFSVYSLNGVRVPKEIAEANHMDFKPEWFTKEQNVEIRREVIRKFGVERICKELNGKVIDTDTVTTPMDGKVHEYELMAFDLGGDVGVWPCLKMVNPSIDTVHMEWVPQGTATVQEALKFRNDNVEPLVLT